MAKPVGFEGANKVWRAPPDMENCVDLETFTDGKNVVSCWRFSDEELVEIARTGVCWINVSSAGGLPPICISGTALIRHPDNTPVIAKAPTWLPIATAPKDGTEILAKHDRVSFVKPYITSWGVCRPNVLGHRANNGEPWWRAYNLMHLAPTPTHWRKIEP